MTAEKGITYLVIAIFLMLLTFGCKEIEVSITKEYVINPNWSETYCSFDVIKMTLKDSSFIDLKNVSPSELLSKLVEDTGFVYRASVNYNGTKYSERKVYFNRDNGFLWWGDIHKSSSTKKILGELKQDTWYLLAGLSNVNTLYFFYIDNLDNLYTFKVGAQYWTNY